MAATIFAVNWEFELRGILVTLIGVAVLMGSIYLLLATNLGARLGFLVALCGLAGWMALMGAIWAIYGIGLQGPLGTWEAVPGRTVLQDTLALNQAGVLGEPVEVPDEMSYADEAALVADQLVEVDGWNGPPVRPVPRPASSSRRPGPSRPASSRSPASSTSAATATR
jgi:hypothetical protein